MFIVQVFYFCKIALPYMFHRVLNMSRNLTARKVSVFGVFLVRIFPHPNQIKRDTEYLSVFGPNAGKYRPRKLRIWTLFTQCLSKSRKFFTEISTLVNLCFSLSLLIAIALCCENVNGIILLKILYLE